MGELLSVRAYARRRNVSHTAVQKAIKDGRLVDSVSRNARGWALIEPELADQEWDSFTDPRKQRGDAALASTPDHPDQGVLFETPPAKEAKPARPAKGEREARQFRKQTQKLTLVDQTFSAKIKALKFKKEAGELLDVHQGQLVVFAAARATRDSLYSMIARIRNVLAAESDPVVVETLLRTEVDASLEHVETCHVGGEENS